MAWDRLDYTYIQRADFEEFRQFGFRIFQRRLEA